MAVTSFRTSLPLAVFLLAAASRIVLGQSAEADTQSWNKLQYTVAVGDRVEFTLSGEIRALNNLRRIGDERLGAGVKLKLSKYIAISPEYEYVARQSPKSYEHRVSFSITGKVPLRAKFALENRHQVQHRFKHAAADSTRYRNRLRISRPFQIGERQIEFFASNEIFYDWGPKAWTRNRFSAGGDKKLTDRLSVEIYYLRQNDSFSRPGDLHVIGSTWKVK